MNTLAHLYNDQGKYDLAGGLFQDCLEKRRRILGIEHPTKLYKEGLEIRRRVLGSDHLSTQEEKRLYENYFEKMKREQELDVREALPPRVYPNSNEAAIKII